jgi:hypothetical protein
VRCKVQVEVWWDRNEMLRWVNGMRCELCGRIHLLVLVKNMWVITNWADVYAVVTTNRSRRAVRDAKCCFGSAQVAVLL